MNYTVPHTPIGFQPLLFSEQDKEELSRCCVFPLTELHKLLAATIMVVEPLIPFSLDRLRHESAVGRKPYPMHPFFRFQLAMPIFRQSTFKDMRRLLMSDLNLRDLCGFGKIPSEATFSRYLKILSDNINMDSHALGPLNEAFFTEEKGGLVLHICRDSTAIPARERAIKSTPKEKGPAQKRGRKKKGSVEEKEFLERDRRTVLEKQVSQTPEEAISLLNTQCSWGGKKNSKGHPSFWCGYKLHLDSTDTGIPTAYEVTGANVHDSQMAIPLEKMTQQRVQHCYSLMDSGYYSTVIQNYIEETGRVALIDPAKRQGSEPFCPSKKHRYKIRTTVERSNAHLKDWLIPKNLCVRGYKKMHFVLGCAVVALAVRQMGLLLEERQKTA